MSGTAQTIATLNTESADNTSGAWTNGLQRNLIATLSIRTPVLCPLQPEFGAKGDGVTDDTTALVACLASIPAGGGSMYLPGGHNFLCQPDSLILPDRGGIFGDGKGSILTYKSGGSAQAFMVDLSGTATGGVGTPKLYQSIRDIQMEGGSFTGPAIRAYYTQAMNLDRIYAHSFTGVGFLDSAQLWDSRLNDLHLLYCGGASGTVINLRSAAAASGMGFSTDSTNMNFLRGIHMEQHQGIGLGISRGPGSGNNNPNGIYVSDFKAESLFCTNQPAISIGAGTGNSVFKNIYLAFDSFNTGSSTAFVGLANAGGGTNYFDNIQFHQGTGLLSSSWTQAAGGVDTINTVYHDASHAPSTAVITISNVQPIILNGVVSWQTTGITPYSGAPTAAPSTGWWFVGTFIRNIGGANMATISGWLCTASGNPGTWRALS